MKLSIKIVCSSVEGQRIDRLRQFDGLEIVGGNWEGTLGPLRAFLPFGTVGKERYMGGDLREELHFMLAYAFI